MYVVAFRHNPVTSAIADFPDLICTQCNYVLNLLLDIVRAPFRMEERRGRSVYLELTYGISVGDDRSPHRKRIANHSPG